MQETTWRAAQQGRGFVWTLPTDPRPSSLAPVFPSLNSLHPPGLPCRPQPNAPGPARAHLRCAFQLRFSSTQISRRRHRWLRPQRGPTNRDSVLARPRPRKAPLGKDRGNWTASARAPQYTYVQLARRPPSRMVLTTTGTRFRGKSVEAAFRAGLHGGRRSCVPWDCERPPPPRLPLLRTSGGP